MSAGTNYASEIKQTSFSLKDNSSDMQSISVRIADIKHTYTYIQFVKV